MLRPPSPVLRKSVPSRSGIGVTRATMLQPLPAPPVIEIPCDDAFSVIVQLEDFRHHKLWRGKRLVHAGSHRRGEVAITDLREEWRCQHLSAFDNMRFHVPRATLEELSRESGVRVTGLNPVQAARDPVVFHLAQAALPAMGGAAADTLFIDSVTLALHTHLCNRYGKQEAQPTAGRLAAWQEARVRDYMLANLARRLTLEEVSAQCGLSRAHFARAFKNTFGVPAHAWLQGQRIARAQQLLASGEKSMTEVALECGFADQSHFSRVFKRVLGVAPAAWLRAR
ncbi:helix-turn-helix domain-containing protein [Herbaspirillum robiniae]|uniref:helix-turn-helix domain-containing protein n=1 Tax=Herbaspirillum robiniae TaxID=2014887 RepID=UPI003D775265